MSTRIAAASPGLRKQPRQARSRATVEAIVEAGARVLAEDGWSGFNTNKVAETAGASIGSLYQYFPDKLSLLEAIRRRHIDECLAALRAVALAGRPLRDTMADWADALIAAHSTHPRLHRALLDEAPSFESFRNPESAFEKAYLACYGTMVATLRPDLASADAERRAITLSDAMDGIIHNAARRGELPCARIRDELVRLGVAYLTAEG